MSGENYVNTASTATTAAPIGPSDTSITVAGYTGYPSAPYWAELEKGTASAEIVRVTNVAGSTLTVTRGQGGTSATSHGAGVNFEHVVPASHFNETETHMAATNAHGVTGNVVGTSGSQTVQDKTFRGAHRSLFSDALPAGVTASYESVADNASARDGFVHKNTGGDAARSAFLAQQSGVDRFKVSNTGNVTISPSTGTALTVDGDETVSGTLDVTGAATLSGGVDTTTVTASGTVSGGTITSTGSINGLSASVLGTVHADGGLDTDGTLTVDGASTLTGPVSAGAGLTVVQGVTAWGGWHLIPSVNSTADVTSPVSGMVVYDQSEEIFKQRIGSVWVRFMPSVPRCELRQTSAQALGSGAYSALTFQAEDLDTHNGHAASGSSYVVPAGWAGSVRLEGGVGFEAGPGTLRACRWTLNGAPIARGSMVLANSTSGSTSIPAKTITVPVAAGDVIALEAWQNSGGSLNTNVASETQSYMSVTWVAR